MMRRCACPLVLQSLVPRLRGLAPPPTTCVLQRSFTATVPPISMEHVEESETPTFSESVGSRTADEILTTTMKYSIITFAWGEKITDGAAFYDPVNNSFFHVDLSKDKFPELLQWLSEARKSTGSKDIRTLLCPAHPIRFSAVEKSSLIKYLFPSGNFFDPEAANVLAKPVWDVVRSVFNLQQQVVRQASPPPSIEHAFLELKGDMYHCITKKSVVSPTKSSADVISELEKATPTRLAAVAWETMFTTFERFGTEGGKKSFSAEEHIVRASVKTVNVFVVDCDNRIQSGSVKNGITYAAEVFNCQTRRSTRAQFRSLQDNSKRTLLTTLLFGEGANTITLLIPSARTKAHQLHFFARICKPKCPFFIASPPQLSKHLNGDMPSAVSAFESSETDPKRYWSQLLSSCGSKEAEEIRHETLLKAATAFALSVSGSRMDNNATALAAKTGRGIIVAPMKEADAFNAVAGLTKSASPKSAPVAAPAPTKQFVSAVNQTYVNKVNLADHNAIISLDEWKKRIYFNDDRLAREKKVVEAHKRWLVVDLETTTTKRYKRIANPFTGENWIVLSGAKDYKGRVFMNEKYFEKDVSQKYDNQSVVSGCRLVKGASEKSLFLPSLDEYDVIVGHNVKFDLMHLWKDAELRSFFKRGGKIWDTLYGEYLLSGQQVRIGTGAGLEAVAKSYGGRTPKLDAVKQAWAEGKNTYEIPPATLIEYLHGDLDNTELIFRKQLERAVEQRQGIIIAARMDGLLCTTEMEFNGLKTDLNVAVSQATELNEKAAELQNETRRLIPSILPKSLHKYWNWASNQHLGLYFFGGPLEVEPMSFLSEKPLPKCGWARHTLSDASKQPQYLGPPNDISAPSECAILAGGYAAEKATKLSKSYLVHYMSDAGFRKSAPWADSLSTPMTAIGKDGSRETGPLINLLPQRYILFTAAGDVDHTTKKFRSMHLANIVSGEKATFNFADDTTHYAKLVQFLDEQQSKYGKQIEDPENPQCKSFLSTQMLFLTRDAPFSFSEAITADPKLAGLMEKYWNNREEVSATTSMTISFLDVHALIEYHRQYSSLTSLPQVVQPQMARGKVTSEPFSSDLFIPCEEWCAKYSQCIRDLSHSIFNEENLTEKKQTKKQREARHKDESTLPLLMRTVPTIREEIKKALSAADQIRYEVLYTIGKSLATNFDPFYVPSFPKVVEFRIPGVLEKYVPEKGVAIAIMEKFRSQQTHALQVGTDTLSYFESTYKDPVAKTISALRAMQKLIGTYYEFSEGGTGMVSLVHESDSCIHHELIHTKTNTGRLASANPNCQNIPKEDKSPLREMFVSRFHNGICIEADYSQLEVITLAALANDKQMIDDLKRKVDFHCKRVTMMRPDISYDEVVLRAKKNKEPDFVKMRQQAKIFSFQRQYGAGVRMLSESTGLSEEQVRAMIEREREIYRECDVFASMVTLSANAYNATIQDGSRNVEGNLLYKGLFPVITGTRYIFSESDLPAVVLGNANQWDKRTNFSPTHLKNYPVQGFAGEIVQILLGRLFRHFIANENYGGRALLVNTVHDCVWVDCTPDVAAVVAEDVERIMSSAKEVLNELWPEMKCVVDFPVDVVAGENMCHLRPLKDLPQIFEAQKAREIQKKS